MSQLPSGRYQAHYINQGRQYIGPKTFGTTADANAYLSEIETDIRKQLWIDPDARSIKFRTYADKWLKDRLDLRPTTRSLYRVPLDKWLLPHVGNVSLPWTMTPEFWRRSHIKVVCHNPKSLQPAKPYKLAHSILNSAVADRRIVPTLA